MTMPILLVPGLNCTAEIYAHQVPALWQFGPVTIANHTSRELDDRDREGDPGGRTARVRARRLLDGWLHRVRDSAAGTRAGTRPGAARYLGAAGHARRQGEAAQRRRLDRAGEVRSRRVAGLSQRRASRPRERRRAQRRCTPACPWPTAPIPTSTSRLPSSNRPDSRPDLGAINVPTLVVVGEADAITIPEASREMAAGIIGAKLVIVAERRSHGIGRATRHSDRRNGRLDRLNSRQFRQINPTATTLRFPEPGGAQVSLDCATHSAWVDLILAVPTRDLRAAARLLMLAALVAPVLAACGGGRGAARQARRLQFEGIRCRGQSARHQCQESAQGWRPLHGRQALHGARQGLCADRGPHRLRRERQASWYGNDFHGRRTANGEIFSANAISCASPVLPLPCYVRVTNVDNGRSVVCRVNDRGPYMHGRVMDLSLPHRRHPWLRQQGHRQHPGAVYRARRRSTATTPACCWPASTG